MAPEYTDAANDVVIFSCNDQNRPIDLGVCPLGEVEKSSDQ